MDRNYFDNEFLLRFNVQKMGSINVEENNTKRLSEYLGISESECTKIIIKFENNVNRMAKEVEPEFSKQLNLLHFEETKKIMFIGDSITSERESHFQIIRKLLGKINKIEFIDSAISGNTTKEIIDRFYPTVLKFNPHLAVIMIGTNDCRKANDKFGKNLVSIDEYENNLNYIIKRLKENGTKIIINTIPYVDNVGLNKVFGDNNWIYFKEDTDKYNDIICKLSYKNKVFLSDCRTKLNKYETEEYLAEDGVHLNNLGQKILAETEIPIILEALKTIK